MVKWNMNPVVSFPFRKRLLRVNKDIQMVTDHIFSPLTGNVILQVMSSKSQAFAVVKLLTPKRDLYQCQVKQLPLLGLVKFCSHCV